MKNELPIWIIEVVELIIFDRKLKEEFRLVILVQEFSRGQKLSLGDRGDLVLVELIFLNSENE